jgi:outer membrane protein OmpA-like peptidoglycan-associated protein
MVAVQNKYLFYSSIIHLLVLTSCTAHAPVSGPDKQGGGLLEGSITGAGAGAITGMHVAAATGPGAAIGAGLGALLGSIRGAALDVQEESLLNIHAQTEAEQSRIGAQRLLQHHYERRLSVHPGRDIYPADYFFGSGDTAVCSSGEAVINELAQLLKDRLPWSRVGIMVYSVSSDKQAPYAQHLSEERALTCVNALVKRGLEPRRFVAQAKVVAAPVVIDPLDHPNRFNEAVEIILMDN